MAGVENPRAPLAPTGAKPPGPPPAGVRVKTKAGTTRIVVGDAEMSVYTAAAWVAIPAALAVIAYKAGAGTAAWKTAVSLFLAFSMLALVRVLRTRRPQEEPSVVCLDEERIWIEHPETPAPWVEAVRTAFADAVDPERPAESLPLDSMPRSVVEQVWVEARPAPNADVEPHVRLLIEASAGRLELIAAAADQERLGWVRDYLRFRLSS